MAKPKILFTSPVMGYPSIGGPELRIENSIKALNQISDLLVISQGYLPPRACDHYRGISKIFHLTPSYQSRSLLRLIKVINQLSRIFLKKRILQVPDLKKDYQFILDIIQKQKVDVIWLGYGNISFELFDYLSTRTSVPIVVDTDSVWSRFILRGLPYALNEEEKNRIEREGLEKEQEEKEWTQRAAVSTAVSEIDAQYYRSLTSQPQNVHLFSNVIDLKSYEQKFEKPLILKHPYIYLAGSFGPRSPMEDAAFWMIEEVMPKVWEQRDDVEFVIVGRGSKESLKQISHPKIKILGEVDTVLPYLTHGDVSVVPLRYESGTRFKILEAGACGVPIVSTTLGAEGIPVKHGVNLLMADEPSLFAGAILTLLEDKALAGRLAADMKELISNFYSIEALADEGKKIINFLGK